MLLCNMRSLGWFGVVAFAGCAAQEAAPVDGEGGAALVTSVPDLAGLEGAYERELPLAAVDPMLSMVLGPVTAGDGPYDRRLCKLACTGESGSYHAIPENPAIGFANILFVPSPGD